MTEIILAIVILFAAGLVCAVLLALASHYMGVEVDETVTKVRECLPGANCGACGYTGCDGYAEALAKGGVKTNLCIPGGASAASAIAAALGVEAEEAVAVCAFVHCNGTDEHTSKCAEVDGCSSCKAACLTFGGGESCIYSCLGCGDCADVCPADAICVKDGIARVDSRLCIGCGMCAKTCPKHIISMLPRSASVAVICSNHDTGAVANKTCKVGCIACRKCEKTCPHGAITVVNNLAVIDYEKCTGCRECVAVCPKKCIKSVDFEAHTIG